MPPRARKTAPEATSEAGALPVEPPGGTPPEEPQSETQEQPCAECFPQGWPADATSVACSAHNGSWQR